MNETAEKHFKEAAAKTCKKTKSENQVKGKVKRKTITKQQRIYNLKTFSKCRP
jgi:hypothetical protein